MTVEFETFVRMPFTIQATQVTEENIDELCKLVGHEVKKKADGTRYIVVNRKIVPQGYRAYIGWWVTQMGDNLRVYPNKVFEDQFTVLTAESATWFGLETEVMGDEDIEMPREDD